MHKYCTLALAALMALLSGPAAAQHEKHPHPGHDGKRSSAKHTATCPVMKKAIKDRATAPHLMVNREPVYVCCPSCIGAIKKKPAKYLKQVKDPVSGKVFTVTAKTPKIEHDGALFLFSSQATYAHGQKFIKSHGHGHAPAEPEKTPKKHDDHGHGDGHGAQPARTPLVEVGQQVPDFTVTDLSGKTLRLSELQKKSSSGVVSLTYWCSFCHSCRHLEKRLDAFAREQQNATVVLIDASAGETASGVTAFAKKTGLKLPILLDVGGKTVDLFGVRATTTTLIVDPKGVLRYRGEFGHGADEPAATALQAVVAGEAVAVKETPQRG